jgi:hypothetical protein
MAEEAPVTAASVQDAPGDEKPAAAFGPGFTVRGRSIWGLQALPFKLLFHHVSRLVSTGHVRRLEPDDLYGAPELDMDQARAGLSRQETLLLACGLPALAPPHALTRAPTTS